MISTNLDTLDHLGLWRSSPDFVSRVGRKEESKTVDEILGSPIPQWITTTGASLFGVGFFALFGWLLLTTHEISGTVDETAGRVDRIADALPELGRMIAWEELTRPIDSILVTTKPLLSNDKWYTVTVVASADGGSAYTYKMPASSQNDATPGYVISGAVLRLEPNRRSFADMMGWSAELERDSAISVTIDAEASFVFTGSPSDSLFDYLSERGGDPIMRNVGEIGHDWESVRAFSNDDDGIVLNWKTE